MLTKLYKRIGLTISFIALSYLIFHRISPETKSIETPYRNPFVPSINIDWSEPIEIVWEQLAKEYFAPWTPLSPSISKNFKVTAKMLNLMEFAYRGGSFRVRICVKNKEPAIYYRKLIEWPQTYRNDRMKWVLNLVKEMVMKDGLIDFDLDFIVYVGDGPKVSIDTQTAEAGFPLFSLRTSRAHVDIPIPDPVAYGSNGEYVWPEDLQNVPWRVKKPVLLFRGRGSCLKMQADNWLACNRIKVAQLAKQCRKEDMDFGIVEWNQLKSSTPIYSAATAKDIEESSGVLLEKYMDFEEQSMYRYILDLDGGLGSSRKPGILSSKSLLVAQESPWFTFFEPLLQGFVHYVPIERWLRNLESQLDWIKQNDASAKKIAKNGRLFYDKFLTLSSAKVYFQKVLLEYRKLQDFDAVDDSPIDVDYCEKSKNAEIEKGPMGCSRGWLKF